MPLYFFDIQDQEKVSRDDIGIECGTCEAVRDAAIEALPDLARDLRSDVERHSIIVLVRDEAGKNVFRASLTLDASLPDEG